MQAGFVSVAHKEHFNVPDFFWWWGRNEHWLKFRTHTLLTEHANSPLTIKYLTCCGIRSFLLCVDLTPKQLKKPRTAVWKHAPPNVWFSKSRTDFPPALPSFFCCCCCRVSIRVITSEARKSVSQKQVPLTNQVMTWVWVCAFQVVLRLIKPFSAEEITAQPVCFLRRLVRKFPVV